MADRYATEQAQARTSPSRTYSCRRRQAVANCVPGPRRVLAHFDTKRANHGGAEREW